MARAPGDPLATASLFDLLHARVATLEGSDDKLSLARAHLELAVAHEMAGDDARATQHAEAALAVDRAFAAAHGLLRRKKHGRSAIAEMLAHLEYELESATGEAATVELLAEKARLVDALGEHADTARAAWEAALTRAEPRRGAQRARGADDGARRGGGRLDRAVAPLGGIRRTRGPPRAYGGRLRLGGAARGLAARREGADPRAPARPSGRRARRAGASGGAGPERRAGARGVRASPRRERGRVRAVHRALGRGADRGGSGPKRSPRARRGLPRAPPAPRRRARDPPPRTSGRARPDGDGDRSARPRRARHVARSRGRVARSRARAAGLAFIS